MESSIAGYLTSAFIGAGVLWAIFAIRLGSFRQHALSLIQHAEAEARQKALSLQLQFQQRQQQEEEKIRQELSRLNSREMQLKAQQNQLSSEADKIKKEQSKLATAQKALEQSQKAAQDLLERNSGLNMADARSALLKQIKETLKTEVEQERQNWQRTFEIECKNRAHTMLLSALERKTQGLTKETFVTEIPLENRSIIPKIIGKEGRNIQTLEELLNVSLIVEEDSPRLLISAHDARQRLLAKWTLEKLIREERITPVTIRETWNTCQTEYTHQIGSQGGLAARKCLPTETLPSDVLNALGNLAFRSTCGQNVLAHSIEVSDLMGLLAGEMGLDVNRAKAIGLFHDIGKGLSKEWGITHALAGKAFLEKWGIDKSVVNGVAAHHGEEPSQTIEARLLPVCDRLSAQLPGARSVPEPAFLSLVRSCEGVIRNLPTVRSAWAHYGGTHIELIIRHEPVESTAPLLSSIHEALHAIDLPIPVHITLV
jgi:ribonuclease Y